MIFSAPAHRWRLQQPLFSGLMPSKARRLIGVAALATLAFVLARLPINLAAGGLLTIAFVMASAIEPAIALIVLALAIPFGNLIPLPLPAGGNTVDVLVVLAIATWLARGIARRELRFSPPPLTWPILILAWCLALSLTQAASWRLGVTEWIKWAEFGALYLIACQILDRRHAAWVLATLFVAGLIEVGQGAYQFLRQVGPKEFILMGRFMRAYGTFNQPNPYAGYLGYLAPVAASLALGGVGRWIQALRAGGDPQLRLTRRSRAWREAGLGFACALVALLLTAGIIMSWSRGSWLGLAVALVVVLTLRARRSAPVFAIALVALATALLAFGTSWLPGPIAQRLSDIDIYSANVDLGRVEVTDANFAVLERLGHWQAGADMFSDHPWLGVGIGNYAIAYPAYARPHFYAALGHAHDIYLNFLAETGTIGAGAFVIFWLAVLGLAWRRLRHSSGNAAALAVGILGTLTYVSVHNVFDNLFVAHLQLQLALLLAMISPYGTDEGLLETVMIEKTNSEPAIAVSPLVEFLLNLPLICNTALARRPKEFERFLKFAIVGLIGMMVDFAVLNLMHLKIGLPLGFANVISFTAAVISNFTWNRLWTFPESRQRPLANQLGAFALVNLVGLGINTGLLLGVDHLLQRVIAEPWSYNLAKAFAIGVVLFWNYFINRLWTYKGIE